MDTFKIFYEKLNKEENNYIKFFSLFCFFLSLCLVISAIYVFIKLKSNTRPVIQKAPRIQYFQKPIIRKQINKSPPSNKGYLVRKKPGYVEQSPVKKTYPTKFKISSILS